MSGLGDTCVAEMDSVKRTVRYVLISVNIIVSITLLRVVVKHV